MRIIWNLFGWVGTILAVLMIAVLLVLTHTLILLSFGAEWVAALLTFVLSVLAIVGVTEILTRGRLGWKLGVDRVPSRTTLTFLFLAVCMFTLLLFPLAGNTSGNTTSGWEFGGMRWNPLFYDPQNVPLGVGCYHADVWHTGHHPFGGFIIYRSHAKVNWCAGGIINHTIYNIRSSTVWTDVSNEKLVDVKGVVQANTNLYGCNVQGRFQPHGCLYIYRKWKIIVEAPGHGIVTTYPWVSIHVNGYGEVVSWDYSRNMT